MSTDNDEWDFMESPTRQPQSAQFRMDSPVASDEEAAQLASSRRSRSRPPPEHAVPRNVQRRPVVHASQLYQVNMAFMRPCNGVRTNFYDESEDAGDDQAQQQQQQQDDDAASDDQPSGPANNYTADMVVRQLRYGNQTQWRPVANEEITSRYEARRRRFLEAGCINSDGSKRHCKRCDYMEPKDFSIITPTEDMNEIERFIRQLHNYYLEHYNDSNIEGVYANYAARWNEKLVEPFERAGEASIVDRLTPVQVEYHFTECNKFYPVVYLHDMIADLNVLRMRIQNSGLYTQEFARGIAVGEPQVSPTNTRLILQVVNTTVRLFNASSNMARNEALTDLPDGFTGKSGQSVRSKPPRKRKRLTR